MQSWTIGAVTVTRIVEFQVKLPYNEERPFIREARPEALATIPWLAPHFVTPRGHLISSVHALLIDAPGLRVIVDTCVGNDKPRRMTGQHALHTQFLEHLTAAGWSRDAVDFVVCTHLHVDHIGWNTMREGDGWVPTFPRARYLIGREEFAYWSRDREAEQVAAMADSIQPIFDAGLQQLVDMDHRISPEIRLQPTPGHTPGHVSVVIESEGERALITGDFIHHPCQIAHPHWSVEFDEDTDGARSMRQGLLASVADQPVLVIGTHFATPTAGYVKRNGEGYEFEV